MSQSGFRSACDCTALSVWKTKPEHGTDRPLPELNRIRMMKEIDIDRIHTVLTRLFLVVCCGVLATACVKDPQKGEDTPDGGESASKYFSYATTREYTVAIDYGFSDYQVLF